MPTWQEFLRKEGRPPEWPYPIRYDKEQEIETDILVLGGGIAGCWAAVGAARKGVRVALVEKAATIRSGAGGSGCDNWENVVLHPLININPEEGAQRRIDLLGGYACGIGHEISCRENYDALLEMEKMGGKIRDFDDEYKGYPGRDEKTKFIIYSGVEMSPTKIPSVLVWGTTFKPLIKNECERLGVKIYDRVMATSLLTEGGIQGATVVGATAFNNRTGEFMVFKAKATILSMGGVGAVWVFDTELAGIATFKPRTISGDGVAMAWRAGAELTMMERSGLLRYGTGHKHHWYSGAGDASYRDVQLVDDNGKALPVTFRQREQWDAVRHGVLKGEYALPFYGDFPAMPEIKRKLTWGQCIGEEATTKIILKTFNEAGFDPRKHLLQNYELTEGRSQAQWRTVNVQGRGGLVVDWDLKTTLDGLYAAGEQMHGPGDHSYAAATGKYAARKAVDYARQVGQPVISKEQVALEKARVYAPIKRSDGIEWKELHAGIARTMQYYCSEYKTESLLNMALDSLKDIEENFVPRLYALDPHKLMRSLEDLSILTYAQIIVNASLARKASSQILDFHRIDYPEVDPSEWNKFITIKLENDKVKVGELPPGYWGNLKKNYEVRNKDYTGAYTG